MNRTAIANPLDRLETKVSQRDLEKFCQRNHIRRMELFGSILTDSFDSKSDIDVLVVFDPAHVPGFAFAGMQDELSRLLGREVDLLTPGFLSESIRAKVRDQSFLIYE